MGWIDPTLWCKSGVRGIVSSLNSVTNEKEILKMDSALISKKCLETLSYYNRTSLGGEIHG